MLFVASLVDGCLSFYNVRCPLYVLVVGCLLYSCLMFVVRCSLVIFRCWLVFICGVSCVSSCFVVMVVFLVLCVFVVFVMFVEVVLFGVSGVACLSFCLFAVCS